MTHLNSKFSQFGPHTSSGGQALALSAYGTNHGYYGVGFYGYAENKPSPNQI